MNSDCPRQAETRVGSFLFRVRHRLQEGATRTPKPQPPVLPNTKQLSRPGGQVAQGPQQSAAQREGPAGPQGGGRTPKLSSGVNHLSSFTEGFKKMGQWGGRITRRSSKTPQRSQRLLREASPATTCVIERDKCVFHSVKQNEAVFLDSSKIFPIRTKNTNIRNHVSFTKKYHMYNSNNSRQQNTQNI